MSDETHENAPRQPDDDSADGGGKTITQAEAFEVLLEENEALKGRIADLAEDQDQREAPAERLDQARNESDRLRRRYADLALTCAISEAAIGVGISPEVAEVYRSRFTCEVLDNGDTKVQPDPTELLVREAKSNPLLSQSIRHGRQNRQASAVAAGIAELAHADPVELITALDRKADCKARFIARHGPQAFVDLAESARRKGYRQ